MLENIFMSFYLERFNIKDVYKVTNPDHLSLTDTPSNFSLFSLIPLFQLVVVGLLIGSGFLDWVCWSVVGMGF